MATEIDGELGTRSDAKIIDVRPRCPICDCLLGHSLACHLLGSHPGYVAERGYWTSSSTPETQTAACPCGWKWTDENYFDAHYLIGALSDHLRSDPDGEFEHVRRWAVIQRMRNQ